jgi:hypothetical protein
MAAECPLLGVKRTSPDLAIYIGTSQRPWFSDLHPNPYDGGEFVLV